MKQIRCVPLVALCLLPDSLILSNQLADFDDASFLATPRSNPSNKNSAEQELAQFSLFKNLDQEKKYIINFNNIGVGEYLRFVSKISNLNFQFNEDELNFTITVVSEEPLSLPNIVSTLIQTLRSRGLRLLEENGFLLITSSGAINQLSTVVTDLNAKTASQSPLVTRVFKLKHIDPTTIASVLKPMVSQNAIIESLVDTRQLIITDLTTNVEKIFDLIQILDAPNSSLEIEVYKIHHAPAINLIQMAKQILEPFAGSAPLTFVSEVDGSSIFIVSTPYLLEKALEVLEDLDALPTNALDGGEVFLYKILHKEGSELVKALEEIADELHGNKGQSLLLVNALDNVRWIQGLNSLLFVATAQVQNKIEEILKTLDTVSNLHNYFVYKIEKGNAEQIENSLEQLSKSLKNSPQDRELTDAIYSMRYVKDSNSLIFTGSEDSLKQLQELLPLFDVAISEYSPSTHYLLYTPEFLNGKELEKALSELETSLHASGLTNMPLLKAIQSMRWVATTNTLLFTGDPASLIEIKSMLKLIDIASGSASKIFLYQPKFVSNLQIEEALDELADQLDHKNLSDRNLAQAIDNMAWIEETNTFLFKADPATIAKIDSFLKQIDSQSEAQSIGNSYFVYKLKFARGSDVLTHLKNVVKGFAYKDPSQQAIIGVVDRLSYLPESNSLLLTGPQRAIEEVKTLIGQFDTAGATPPELAKTSFFIYKPKHISPLELKVTLQATAEDLKQSGLVDPLLLQSIDTLRIVEMTGSVLFTGSVESLKKTEEIISLLDVPSPLGEELGEFQGHSFFIYKLHYISMQEMLHLLTQFTTNLQKEGGGDSRLLLKTLQSVKELADSNSLLFTGPTAVLEKIAELLRQLDIPETTDGNLTQVQGSYLIYKPIHVSGPELIDMVRDFEENLKSSGIRDYGLYQSVDNLKYITKTGYILVSGSEQAIGKVQELLKKFDTQGNQTVTSLSAMGTSFLVYKLHYHNGKELQATLKSIAEELKITEPQQAEPLMRSINSLQWVKITNSLLATGTPEVLTQLKELIESIDVPLRQVFIEVLIIQTTLTNNQQFGLQWGSKLQFLNRLAGSVSNFPSPNPDSGSTPNQALSAPLAAINGKRTPLGSDIPAPTSSGGFDLGVIGDIILHKGKTFLSLASLVNALQQDNDSVIVMNPKIIAQDNQKSTIFVGQNIPFGGSSVATTQNAGTQEITNIEYRDVGVSLSITPILGRSNMVTLDISNEITAQVANTTADVQNLQGLQTSRTSLNARVHVPDRHFVALSGMIQDTKSHFKSSIPCLGGLPLIGALFSENDRFNSRDNVIFFLRPVIIDSIEEYKKITENQENLFKELGVKQIVKEEIDEGIDWVKTPENE